MKYAYPIIITAGSDYQVVYVPDFDINTEGVDIPDAIKMARDAIGLVGIDMQDDGKKLPTPSELSSIQNKSEKDSVVTLVDVDFDEYRRMNDNRAIHKNCTLPAWLCYKAEKSGINFSRVLQEAISKELNI